MADSSEGARASTRFAAGLFRGALDLVLPPHCLKCGVLVDQVGTLCAACWAGVDFIQGACCSRCGLPFDVADLHEAACGACLRKPPLVDRARAVMVYDDASRDLILGFKHADKTEAAPAFGDWMARAQTGLIEEADLIAPVPLHWSRLMRRQFNQSALLAWRLGKVLGRRRDVVPDLLKRTRRTPPQGGLGGAGRKRNMAGAFAVNAGMRRRLEGARVLLVDDVYTTGATIEACARVLLRSGAKAVDALTLARVVRPSN